MNVGILVLLTVFISVMLFMIQRAEPKRRLVVALLVLGAGELIRRYVIYRSTTPLSPPFTDLISVLIRGDNFRTGIYQEAWWALGIAVFLNVFFWLFIGRYNPVKKSDEEIQVLGLDD